MGGSTDLLAGSQIEMIAGSQIEMIFLGLDCLVLLTLVGYVLKGLISGTAKTLFTTGIKWILILIFIIFSNLIAETIVSMSIPTIGSIDEYLTAQLAEALNMNLSAAENIHTYTLIHNLVVSIVRIVVVIVGFGLISVIVYPFISLILMLCGVRKKINEIKKPLWSRLVGVVLGIIAFIGCFSITFMPVYGMMTLATTISQDVDLISELETPSVEEEMTQASEYFTYEKLDNVDNPLTSIIDSFDKSFIYKMFKNDEGKINLAERYLDSLIKIETNQSRIKIINEYYNLRTVLPVLVNVTNASEEENNNVYLTVEEVNVIIKMLQKTKIIETALPVAVEYLIANKTLEKYDIDANKLANNNWKEEVKYLNEVLEICSDLYAAIYEYKDDMKQFIGDEQFVTLVPNLVEAIFKLNLVQEFGIDLANEQFEKVINDYNSDQAIGELLSLIEINNNIVEDVRIACAVLSDVYNIGFITEDIEKIDFSETAKQELLANAIIKIFSLSFIEGNEEEIIKVGLGYLEAEKYVEVDTLNIQGINWDTEPTALANIVKEYLKLLDGKGFKDDVLGVLISENNEALIDACVSSTIFTKVLLPVVDGLIVEKLTEENLTELTDIIVFSNLSTQNLKTDLIKLTTIIRDLETIGVFEELELTNEEVICEILQTALSLEMIKGKEGVLINSLLKYAEILPSLEAAGITIDTDNVDWAQEAVVLSKLIVQLNAFDNMNIADMMENITPDNQAQITELLKTALQVQIIQKSFPTLIRQTLTEEGLEKWTSEWLAEQEVTFKEEEWLEEVDKIIDLFVYYQSKNITIDSLSEEQVADIKVLLEKMVNIKLFNLNQVIDLMNSELQAYVKTTKTYLTIKDNIDWSKEIDILLGVEGIYLKLMSFNDSTTFAEYGKLLDLMLTSSIFENGFYELVSDYIKTLSVYEKGVLNAEDLSQANLEKVTSWEQELGLIDQIDLEANTQSGETLDIIMQSVLLRRQVTVYISNIIEEEGLSDYYSSDNLSTDIASVNTRIDAGNKTPDDDSDDWSWAKEVANIQEFATKLDAVITKINALQPPAQTDVQALKTLADEGTITKNILERVLEEYPTLKVYLN